MRSHVMILCSLLVAPALLQAQSDSACREAAYAIERESNAVSAALTNGLPPLGEVVDGVDSALSSVVSSRSEVETAIQTLREAQKKFIAGGSG